ncbi:OmpA family protein [Pseudoduganella sp. OTU4001]|uniref:OmpA family protein n=1 Tax=Pseudoduganella sp. OTU4001 TaxID=3043854 RepID=UPI00313A78FB
MLVSLLSLALPALAQSDKVLKPQEVTEAVLIEALTPATPVRTRSIRVTADTGTPNAAAAPAAKPSTNLLITFQTNSSELTSHAKQVLNVVGRALSSDKLSTYRFSIEGHADPRGASDANQTLSQARAESVRQYLVHNTNIDTGRLDAIGKGDKELMNKVNPIAPENRRVTIVNMTP